MRAAGAVHNSGINELTMKLEYQIVTISTFYTSIPRDSRLGHLYVVELDQMWNKLKATGIMPMATMDLNW